MILIAAWQLGALPLVWLLWLAVNGKSRGALWWTIAAALFVSWLADGVAWLGMHSEHLARLGARADLVGNFYPITQTALIAAVLLDREEALNVVMALAFTAFLALVWKGPFGIDVLLSTVAWLTVAGLVWQRCDLGRLRLALLVAFGAGWVCWLAYAIAPGWTTWGAYQATRAIGAVLFCWAASTAPALHSATRTDAAQR